MFFCSVETNNMKLIIYEPIEKIEKLLRAIPMQICKLEMLYIKIYMTTS